MQAGVPHSAVGVELVPKAKWSLGANLTAQAGPRWPVRPIALVTKAFSRGPLPGVWLKPSRWAQHWH